MNPQRASLVVFLLTACATSATAQEFFAEDFSKTKRGKLPEGWRSETMLVKGSALVIFKPGKTHTLHGPTVKLPKNFRFDWVLRSIQVGKSSFGSATYQMQIGNVSVKLTTEATAVVGSRSRIAVNDTAAEIKRTSVDGTTVKLAIEKRDDVFRAFVNGKEAVVARQDDFQHDNTFTFQVQFKGLERNYGQFKLVKVVGKQLGGER